MTTFDLSGSGSIFSSNGGYATAEDRATDARVHSILAKRPDAPAQLAPSAPDYFGDLNLDQVLDAFTSGREQHQLEEFFYLPLHDADHVHYRHEVLRDLEKPEVRSAIAVFAQSMEQTRGHLAQVEELSYELQKQSWQLDAVEIYCDAVLELARDLDKSELVSRGLQGLREYLTAYTRSRQFSSLVTGARALEEALGEIRYSVRIQGPRVTVTKYDGEADYSAKVNDTFVRFQQGAAKSYMVALLDDPEMNHVEARILAGVAQLYPEAFEARAAFCARHRDFLDPTVARFDREAQFYVGYLELTERLIAAGLPFCYPRVSASSKEVAVKDAFDLALACKLVRGDREVVRNDFYLAGPERMLVVSGPNNGGKTTFARTVGQLHHLAALGLPVPGSEARLFLADQIFTHFEREEAIETLRGKFDEELVRVRAILERATSNSLIVMNESFSSTTLSDASVVGTEVMGRILELGCLGVYVTFVDEIASLGEGTVSMVAEAVPDDPAERTFKLLRKPADGLAYAWAIAEKYGLTYERLIERIGT